MWHVGGCGVCVVGKMAKDVGTAIRKSIAIVVSCLVAFLGFYPYTVLHFFLMFFL